MGGLFCAGLGPNEDGDSTTAFGDIYPPFQGEGIGTSLPKRRRTILAEMPGLTHYLLPHPELTLCTENLTPFLSLLPSKGQSGLSHLLAQPGVIFSWGFQSEGIEVIMPEANCRSTACQGRWRGWWEGVVDLVPEKGGSREFSISSLLKRHIPRSFPETSTSIIRLIKPSQSPNRVQWLLTEPDGHHSGQWADGEWREVIEWDASTLAGGDIRFWWNEEPEFTYRTS